MSEETEAVPALPTDSKHRKTLPLATGFLDYFPSAAAEIARLSRAGNDKHNPGQPMHWARGKSSDHADCILRHLADRGTIDPEDGFLHDVKVAWRAMALLQEALEARGAPMARGARPAKNYGVEIGEGLKMGPPAQGRVVRRVKGGGYWVEFPGGIARPARAYEIDQYENTQKAPVEEVVGSSCSDRCGCKQ